MRRSNVGRWVVAGLAVAAITACGASDSVSVDPLVGPFVGTWDAVVLTMASQPDSATIIDLLGPPLDAKFHIEVEASGTYTATLEIPGTPGEIGQLTVIGNTLRLDPTIPAGRPAATAEYRFTGADHLTLDGESEFDFNLDGTDDPAFAHFELQRR
jgi:hypothetical protein